MTEKRAYAVVRESPDGLLYLNFEGWQESVALFRSDLKKDERVEIRLRVAQGEDAVRKALTLAMRWMEDENAGPVAPVLAAIDAALAAAPEEPVLGGNPRNHLLGCAYKNKPSLGVAACDCGAYSPPAAHEEQEAPRGWAFDGAHSGGSATHATDTTTPAALPEEGK